jgi:hypothetical protein
VDLRLVFSPLEASSPEIGLRLRGEPLHCMMGQRVATRKRGNYGSPCVVSAGIRATAAGHDEIEANAGGRPLPQRTKRRRPLADFPCSAIYVPRSASLGCRAPADPAASA